MRPRSPLHACAQTEPKLPLPSPRRYILNETMGAAGEDERRRAELAHVSGRAKGEVSDAEVVASFVESVGEGGFMRRFLQLGQLAVQVRAAKAYPHPSSKAWT